MFRRCGSGAALVLTAAWGLSAQAAVLQLAPIPIEVEAPQAAAVLSLSNRGPADVALQARVFGWSQDGGEDRLTPTQDVVVSPPIASVPGGQTLTLRVVRVAGQPVAAEETYRIWVDELPSDKGAAKGQSLRILMRYSVPVFYSPAQASKDEPTLTWQLARGAKGAFTLTGTNPGPRRVRFSELQLQEPLSKALLLSAGSELSGYVLAGRSMRWTVRAPKDFPAPSDGTYRLEYRTEAKRHRENLALGVAR
jgi:fimbrial chaperone protein